MALCKHVNVKTVLDQVPYPGGNDGHKVNVHPCAKHGKCTLVAQVEGATCCNFGKSCKDYDPLKPTINVEAQPVAVKPAKSTRLRTPLPCIHRGEETGETRPCPTCKGSVEVKIFRCGLVAEENKPKYGTCTVDKLVKGEPRLQCCRICDDREEATPAPVFPDAVTVNIGAGGIGDGLTGLLITGAVKRDTGKPVVYRCGPKAMPWVSLFHGFDHLAKHEFDDSGKRDIRNGELQLNNGYAKQDQKTNRWERYARNAGVRGPLVLPKLREPERIHALGTSYAGCIAIAPFSRWSDREYSLPNWLTLERVLSEAGYRVVILDDEADRTKPFKSEVVRAAPDRVAGIIANAAAFIGNDSGLTHLAGILGVLTFAICGQTKGEQIYGCYPRAKILRGALDCYGCYWKAPVHTERHCSPHCPNIQSIRPQDILEAIDRELLPQLAGGRTLVDWPRLAAIRQAVLETNHLAGDVAELGVFRGGSAKVIGHYAKGAKLHLFDTFTGIPETDTHGEHRAGEFACDEDSVLDFLANPNAVPHKGIFPETAPADPDLRFRFGHLDGDTYQTTRAAIEYFRPRMVADGIILFDDYNWWKCPGVGKALEESGLKVEQSAQCQAKVRF